MEKLITAVHDSEKEFLLGGVVSVDRPLADICLMGYFFDIAVRIALSGRRESFHAVPLPAKLSAYAVPILVLRQSSEVIDGLVSHLFHIFSAWMSISYYIQRRFLKKISRPTTTAIISPSAKG
jgi:hypothetical protein